MAKAPTNSQWATAISTVTTPIQAENDVKEGHSTLITAENLAKTIDHTLLKLDATEEQIRVLCGEAKEWGFKTVCVRLPFVVLAAEQLRGTDVGVTCVIGFHEGTHSTEEKVREAQSAIEKGATELDLVLNHTLLFSTPSESPDYAAIFEELVAVRAAAPQNIVTKLIFETAALHCYVHERQGQAEAEKGMSAEDVIIAATILAWHAGFDFVKTSTGFWTQTVPGMASTGASVQDVSLMHKTCRYLLQSGPVVNEKGASRSKVMKVKASGGIRTLKDAEEMLQAGAERLGVSAGVAIMKEKAGGGEGENGAKDVSNGGDGY